MLPLGCGKSSLLEAMNGELTRVAGMLELRDDLAIVSAPQRAWIVASTLKANVLLGAPSNDIVDEALYARALSDCALKADLEQLEHGDATLLGERGVNLSGGQQARVALARALYAALFSRKHTPEVPVLALLDDPLAALDATVANHVLEHAILAGFVGEGCGVLVASHSKMLLDHADTVLTLAPDGGQTTDLEQGADTDIADVRAASVPMAAVPVEEEVSAVVAVAVAEEEKPGPPPQMMKEEERQTGSVTWDTWRAYAKSGALTCRSAGFFQRPFRRALGVGAARFVSVRKTAKTSSFFFFFSRKILRKRQGLPQENTQPPNGSQPSQIFGGSPEKIRRGWKLGLLM
jgi:ABC-type hemin transport system ATPase subunit